MTLLEFIRIALGQFKLMLLLGFSMAGMVFYSTRNQPREYASSTLVNTGLVSGYNLESEGTKIDFGYTNNEMENLVSLATSYNTIEELAMRLLAKYSILENAQTSIIDDEGWEELQKPEFLAVKQLILVPGDSAATLANIKQLSLDRQENDLQKLIYSEHPFFGIEKLQSLNVSREGKSDQLRFKYTTIDPAICRETLVEFTRIFSEKQRHLKEVQSTDVLEFFEKATRDAASDLSGREDGLLAFMEKNKIINYYEQTRFIAAKKEDLDEMYFQELMALAGADSTIKRLEEELSLRINLPDLNRKLIMKRDELADISARIAQMEVSILDTVPSNSLSLAQMKTRANQLKSDIKHTASATYAVNKTPEGIETKELLNKWINHVVEVEQAFARLNVLRSRQQEFDVIYGKFAPWGSKIKRMEREIDVAERAYLENLHSFNQAKLHQYNMMMSANLNVVDPPMLPVKPAASKRMILVIVSFLAGFIIPLVVAIILEFLDSTLKNPLRAAEVVGLEVVGAFPRFPIKQKKSDLIDYDFIRERSFGQLLQQVKLNLRAVDPKSQGPKRVAIISTRKGEGKSYISREVVERMRRGGEKVAFLFPDYSPPSPHPDDYAYEVDHNFFEIKRETDLIDNPYFKTTNYQYIFLELPGLLTEAYPVELAAQYEFSLLVARANRNWNAADAKALATFQQSISHAPKIAVNLLKPETLENSLGEIPKRRSRLRKLVKKIVMFDFSKKELAS